MKKKSILNWLIILFTLFSCNNSDIESAHKEDLEIGYPIDSLNKVKVYYNQRFGNVSGRNTVDGYNLGLKYQCVEFVKRYYFEHYNHKMPNSYGHAKDFFNKSLKDGNKNIDRNLTQYSNPSKTKPQVGDLIIFNGHSMNKYGHVAIVSKVINNSIEVIQQNVGLKTREIILLSFHNDLWEIEKDRTLGWLRKE